MGDDLSHFRLDVPNMGDSNCDGESAFSTQATRTPFTFLKRSLGVQKNKPDP